LSFLWLLIGGFTSDQAMSV